MRVPSLALIFGVVCLGGGADDCPPGQPPASAPTPESSTGSYEGLSLDEEAQNVPGPPGKVHVAHRDGLHVVEWRGTRDDTIGGYEVRRQCRGEAWRKVGLVKLREDDPRNRGPYRFEETLETVCRYTVAAVTPGGRAGPTTIEIQ